MIEEKKEGRKRVLAVWEAADFAEAHVIYDESWVFYTSNRKNQKYMVLVITPKGETFLLPEGSVIQAIPKEFIPPP